MQAAKKKQESDGIKNDEVGRSVQLVGRSKQLVGRSVFGRYFFDANAVGYGVLWKPPRGEN